MTTEADAPRLLVIVANGITGDSRVQKTAIAAARAGWDVTLLGAGGRRGPRVTTQMGAVRVIREPLKIVHAQRRSGHSVRRFVTQTTIHGKDELTEVRAAHQAWLRQTTARIGMMRTRQGVAAAVLSPAGKALGAMVRVRRAMHNLRLKAYRWEQRQTVHPTGRWRKDWPTLVDFDLVFGPIIEKLKPDVIHANDMTMIHVAALSVGRMRARGERVSWLYDAHEYVQGIDWPRPRQNAAYRAVEKEFIRQADAVVTVSPEIAELLQKDNRLPKTPLVVRNTPIRETIGATKPKPSVRGACGLADDVPLLVYSGWLAPERGLGTAVTALSELPDVHLAIVSGASSPERESLLERAQKLGVRDRIHVVPYVPQYAVPDYLSTADLGLICSQHTLNYEISLPTKLAEYLHAGVPVVASDVRTLGAFVNQHQVGEVFVSDDAPSFAKAVGAALARRKELAGNITEPLLEELSWEHQVDGLLKLYREIAPRVPAATRTDVSWAVEEVPVDEDGVPDVSAGPRPHWRPLTQLSRVRLGLAPANYAGQLASFAQAICQEHPDVSAEVTMRRAPTGFLFPADVYLETPKYNSLALQTEQLNRVIGRYTHLIADAFIPVFGNLNGDTIEGDLPALRRAGISVALLAHGSEVRDPVRHRERHPFSLFLDAPAELLPILTERAANHRRIAETSGCPLFVTTPDLLDDLPDATWAPLVVNVEAWASDQPVMERPRPRVLHGPSARWTKGTDRILPALTALHDKGAIELVLAEKIPWAEMHELVRGCDIVVDQFGVGAYGTFAVEAMSAGRPVIARLDERVHAAAGVKPPIVNATPDTITEAVESLLDDRPRAQRLGAESAEYARENHDGRRTARAFESFLARPE